MIIPCIDLQGGKVVQLVQGKEKALEGPAPDEMLRLFADFPQLQLIDLDAAMGTGDNAALIARLAGRSKARVGGGVRSVEAARRLLDHGADRVIVGTAAFGPGGVAHDFLGQLAGAVGADRLIIALDSKGGRIVVKGWQEATALTAETVVGEIEPYCSGFLCTYVDKEGIVQGTDLDWFARLRAATGLEITAAGGITTMDDIRALTAMRVDAAVGMAVYTGRLSLAELAAINCSTETSALPGG